MDQRWRRDVVSQWLKALTAIPVHQSSIPSILIGQNMAASNSRSNGSNALIWTS